MTRVLIIDDQIVAREGLKAVLSLADDIEVIGEAACSLDGIAAARRLLPDVILMDVRMPEGDGIQTTRQILSELPQIHVLMLSTFDEDEYILEALKAGASGYLLKDTAPEDLHASIRLLHHGQIQLGPTIAPKVLARLQPYVPHQKTEVLSFLSEREQDVLRLIGKGFSNQQIASSLCLTDGTVRNYVSRILTALGVRDRTQAALWSHQHMLN